jgi:hypothetical protein
MRLEKASHKAIKYACMNFHYAKSVPSTRAKVNGYSVFNDNGDWCGVIIFSGGASANMGTPYKLKFGQYAELVRMALNGKQTETSKSMAIAIKLFKKDNPLVKILISYADKGQNHLGIIYQATNWFFTEESESSGTDIFYKGVWRHDRNLNELPKNILSQLPKRKRSGKYKYIYPLHKSLIPLCKSLAKPYPKNAAKVLPVAQQATSQQEGFDSTLPLKKQCLNSE